MIIKEFQLEKIIKSYQSFECILIYGPNEGLVKEHINQISHNFLATDKFEHINFNGKDLDNDPEILNDNIKTVSMFHENKVIVAENIKDKHLNIIENIVLNPPQQVILIIKDGILSKASKIRKFFETDKKCVSLACYEDDVRSMSKIIEEFVSKNNLVLSREIKNYLQQSLSYDRLISKQELEKIEIAYKSFNRNIEIDDIKKLMNDSSSQNLNKMNENVMFGNTSKSSIIINKLLSEGASPISLIKSLTNYLIRIQKTKVDMGKGNSFDISIKTLKPPVFWKDKDSFQRHCLQWP